MWLRNDREFFSADKFCKSTLLKCICGLRKTQLTYIVIFFAAETVGVCTEKPPQFFCFLTRKIKFLYFFLLFHGLYNPFQKLG